MADSIIRSLDGEQCGILKAHKESVAAAMYTQWIELSKAIYMLLLGHYEVSTEVHAALIIMKQYIMP